ncbi:hypothetical protein B0H13DRAFT_1891929 [Mycena leptocephala]|nr:hypothetical protein B0H13DRAFT_1891929 [Mycena leptocephala]
MGNCSPQAGGGKKTNSYGPPGIRGTADLSLYLLGGCLLQKYTRIQGTDDISETPYIQLISQHQVVSLSHDKFQNLVRLLLLVMPVETVHWGAAVKSKDPNKIKKPFKMCSLFNTESPGDDNSDFDKASAWPGVIDFEKPAVFSVSGRPQPTRGLNGRRSAGNASRDDGALITDGCEFT